MEKNIEGVEVKLNPKMQELYARLEEEKLKNARLQELALENARLSERVEQLEAAKPASASPREVLRRTRKKMALQEQLQEKRLHEELLSTRQQRIDALLEALDDQQEIQQLDSKSLSELKAALNTLIESREKGVEQIRKLSEKNRLLLAENENLKFTRSKLAHDLRSLMSSILGTLTLIDLDEREVVENLKPTLEARCHVFMNLINAISHDELKIESLSIAEVVQILNLNVEDTTRTVRLSVQGGEIPIEADRAALYDILQNLVNNAVKYSGRSIDDLIIRIGVTQAKDRTIIEIEDNGKGIPARSQDRIFNLYDRAGLKDKQGRGIGLFMVKNLVERHEGTIIYDQSYTDGARFVITLPSAS
jgi:signal transduction histidine kinase